MTAATALRLIAAFAVLLTASCARRAPVETHYAAPLTSAAAAVVYPPAFRDADPYEWSAGHPENYAVHGIDLSRWQPSVDWRTARANGVNFAFIKATEGGDRVDPYFMTHWQNAGEAGVAHGAYHFYYFCTSAEVQARWFIENVPRTPGALPPVLDVEWNPQSPTCTLRPPGATVRSEMNRFLDIVGNHYGQRPIIYTTRQFWDDNDLGQMGREEFWFRSTAGHPAETYDGEPWSFWQYSGTGLVPGIAGRVDLNVFAGTEASWSRWRAARSL